VFSVIHPLAMSDNGNISYCQAVGNRTSFFTTAYNGIPELNRNMLLTICFWHS